MAEIQGSSILLDIFSEVPAGGTSSIRVKAPYITLIEDVPPALNSGKLSSRKAEPCISAMNAGGRYFEEYSVRNIQIPNECEE